MNFINKLNSGLVSSLSLAIGWIYIIFSCGCMLDSDADFDFPTSEKSLVVESYLCPGKNYEVLLMESNNLSDDLSLLLSWRAQVCISTRQKVIPLYNILNIDRESGYTFNYGTHEKVPCNYEETFELDITTLSGEHIKASTPVVAPVSIKDYKVNDKSIEVSFENDPVVIQRYYFLIAEGVFEEKPVRVKENLDCREMPGGVIKCILKGDFQLWESLKIKLFHISQANYDFQKSVKNASSANSNTFSVPSKIKSNIQGAEGIFTYYTVDSIRVR